MILVDTPGFNDTNRSDTDILTALVEWMKDSYKERQLSGIIYLHPISDVRMTGSSLQNIRMFRKLCGDDNLENVILATTKWGITPESDALSRERELCSDDGFWGLLIKNGSLVRRFENTKVSARCLVDEILHMGKERFTPKIQHEVVELGKKLSDTDAGAYISAALIDQAKKHQEEMTALMEEQDRAQRKRKRTNSSCLICSPLLMSHIEDRTMQEALKKERERLEKRIAIKEEEQRILHLTEVEALNKRFEDLQRSVKEMNGAYINKQGFWHTTWKCLLCKTKTEKEGQWTCPNCRCAHRNVAWGSEKA